MEILEIFGENRLDFLEKKQDRRDLMNDSNWSGKNKQGACNILRVWPKNEENFERAQENSLKF